MGWWWCWTGWLVGRVGRVDNQPDWFSWGREVVGVVVRMMIRFRSDVFWGSRAMRCAVPCYAVEKYVLDFGFAWEMSKSGSCRVSRFREHEGWLCCRGGGRVVVNPVAARRRVSDRRGRGGGGGRCLTDGTVSSDVDGGLVEEGIIGTGGNRDGPGIVFSYR